MQDNSSVIDAAFDALTKLESQPSSIANDIYDRISDSLKGRTGEEYRLVADAFSVILTTIASFDTIDEAVIAITAMQKLMRKLADEADQSSGNCNDRLTDA